MRILFSFLFISLVTTTFAQYPVILSQREQAKVIDELLEDRVRTVLPTLMRREGFDMWVVISSEYNEDPVIRTFLPATWFAARRTTMLVMFDRGADKEIECLAVSRYDVGKIFKRAWDPDSQPDQWAQLAKLIDERNPKKIGVNFSDHYGHADGLTFSHHQKMINALAKKHQGKVVSAEKLAVGWLETRTDREMII